ncbi:MAG: DUF5691 domain-containing protein [Candidatus Methylumidiphilus sp.]
MQALQQLAAQAIVGTDRQPLTLPTLPGAAGELLAALTQTQSEPPETLLRAAGVVALCGLAGHRPTITQTPTAEPCPAETLPPCQDAELAGLLDQILSGNHARLQAEALRRLAGAALPYPLLPKALELGRGNRALRPPLLAVLGQRGHWLARQNPEWAYAAGTLQDHPLDIAVWDTGSLDQRLVYLRRCRADDPPRGRELLAAALPEANAKERAALLAELETQLSPADEDLLETLLLKDRGKEVRQTAAALLARLPASRYAGRMQARLETCLSTERKLLRSKLILTPPETFGADWKNDGLEEAKPTYEPLGQRAWWLYQLTCATPLHWWTQHTGMTPDALLAWAEDGEWRDALWRGWLDAQNRSADPLWAEAFLSRWPHKKLHIDAFRLIRCLELTERERHWLRLLQEAAGQRNLGRTLLEITAVLPLEAAPFSVEFARAILAQIVANLSDPNHGNHDYYLRQALPDFACLLPPELFPEAQTLLAAIPDEALAYGGADVRLSAIIEQRNILHTHPLLHRSQP